MFLFILLLINSSIIVHVDDSKSSQTKMIHINISQKGLSFLERINEIIKQNKKDKLLYKRDSIDKRRNMFLRYNNSCNIEKYVNKNSYEIYWIERYKRNNILNFNTVVIDNISKISGLYLREFKKIKNKKKNSNSFKSLLLEQFFTLLNYNNLVGFISNRLCNCGINESNIRKSIYNNKIIYFAEKKFTRIEDGFKVKHDFKIKISKYGEIVDLNWTQLGERIDKPKMKSKKKKK